MYTDFAQIVNDFWLGDGNVYAKVLSEKIHLIAFHTRHLFAPIKINVLHRFFLHILFLVQFNNESILTAQASVKRKTVGIDLNKIQDLGIEEHTQAV